MDQAPVFLVALVITIIFGSLGWRTWHVCNRWVKWGGTVICGLCVLVFGAIAIQALYSLILHNLHALNAPLLTML